MKFTAYKVDRGYLTVDEKGYMRDATLALDVESLQSSHIENVGIFEADSNCDYIINICRLILRNEPMDSFLYKRAKEIWDKGL